MESIRTQTGTEIQITDEAEATINSLLGADQSIAEFIGDAIATKRWVDTQVDQGNLYVLGDRGKVHQVLRAS